MTIKYDPTASGFDGQHQFTEEAAMSPHDEQARALVEEWFVTKWITRGTDAEESAWRKQFTWVIIAALREAEARGWEEAAELAQVADLVESDGHTPIEKLKIWVILGKFITLCRAQAASRRGGG